MISVDEVKEDFQSFLDIEGNTRIFFSGRFGVGKTYFLSSFFEKNVDKYDVYHLFPVQYQIHSNDDVVDLLKYDLLVELSKKNENIFKENKVEGIKESSLLFYSWIKEKYSVSQTLQSILSAGEFLLELSPDPVTGLLGKLGRPMKNLLKIDEEFQKFKKEYKHGEKGLVEKYEKAIRTKIASESDYISSLVKEKIIQNKKGGKSVLVLDDMDRIDPEHIFRVLNVLSAHFERDRENKFGFDVVIFVADYSSLKHIFHHRYGSQSDFDGYIDKFFAISPYYFDNKKAILSKVSEIVKAIKNENPNLDLTSETSVLKIILKYILTQAVESGSINLRQLLKAVNFRLIELRKGGYYEDQFADNRQKIFDIAIKILIHSFSNTNSFLEEMERIKSSKKIETETRVPLDRFTQALLKFSGVNMSDDFYHEANERVYHIKKGRDDSSIFVVAFNKQEGRNRDLFYDLLIQYVKDRKYIKNNPHEYRI